MACYVMCMTRRKRRHAASAAVIALRQAMGMTQQRFAVVALKTAITTVGRYETTHPPRGEALLHLAKIADQNDLPDLAHRFRRLHWDDLLSAYEGITLDAEANAGWLIMKLNGRERIDDAIDFFERYRTGAKDDRSWLDWKKHVGYKGKGRKRQ